MADHVGKTVYRIRVEPSGESFDCPAGKPILDAAHAADILITYSCRGGLCGTCKGRILEGRIDYPAGMPAAIDAAESATGRVLFCSAHATTDLVIELPVSPF